MMMYIDHYYCVKVTWCLWCKSDILYARITVASVTIPLMQATEYRPIGVLCQMSYSMYVNLY